MPYIRSELITFSGGCYQPCKGVQGVASTEGKKAWQEAIDFIEDRANEPLPALRWESGVSLAARDHVEDQGPQGLVGHPSSDRKTTPFQRI